MADSSVVTSAAQGELGKPYIWDSPTDPNNPNPAGFDCSGLTMWCYNKAGIELPHSAISQYGKLAHRPVSEAQPGDLIFVGVAGVAATIHHVMVYMGNGQVIEAPDFGIPVRINTVAAYGSQVVANAGVFPGTESGVTTATGPKPPYVIKQANAKLTGEVLVIGLSQYPLNQLDPAPNSDATSKAAK